MAESSPIPKKRRETRKWSMEITQDLLSSSGPLTEELQCSVCLDVFTDPVTVPCGHNFCKSCLIDCWEKRKSCYCPNCKEKFSRKPKLKTNTALRQVVQIFKENSRQSKSEVLCDICDEQKLKALKSCLMCQSSYCEIHLEPHHRVPRLKKHKLVNAVINLEDYICKKHDRPLELFCRDDQTCVCLSCTDGDHKNHNTVPLEEESQEKKTQVMDIQTEVQKIIKDRTKKIQDIKDLADFRKLNMDKDKAVSIELFSGLIRSIEKNQTDLLETMEKQQKTAEKLEKEQIEELQQEIIELKRREEELEQISQTQDHLHFIQIFIDLSSSISTKNWPEISFKTSVSLNNIRTAMTKLQKTLDQKLSKTELKRMRLYAVDVILDPETAHPKLILSDDGKQVSYGDIRQNIPDNSNRFDQCVYLLGKEGFSLGRFYYEVKVMNKTGWNLGVAKESVQRKGRIKLSPRRGYWMIWLRNGNEYKALAGPSVFLSLKVKPQTVGVFVDYEEGLVSFYDVESKSHIYSFTGQTFTEKLYPYFCPMNNIDEKNSAPLIISPVRYNE